MAELTRTITAEITFISKHEGIVPEDILKVAMHDVAEVLKEDLDADNVVVIKIQDFIQ